MSKGEFQYKWKVGEPPPELAVHSVMKHKVIETYVQTYLRVLTGNPRVHNFRIVFVDGFAGGGLYRHELTKEEILGSPLIFLNSSRIAVEEINATRSHKLTLDASYFFVELEPDALEYLGCTLRERGYQPCVEDGTIRLLPGKFVDRAPEIVRHISTRGRSPRAIFLLDQYGYKDVPFDLLREVFRQLPHAEVILTFAMDALTDYITDNVGSRRVLDKLGICESIDLSDFSRTKGASDRRFYIQSRLGPVLYRACGAQFFTPFFIASRDSNREYWLIHLSMHETARDEMAKLHWKLQNYFRHNGRAGLNMLGYDPRSDDSVTGQPDFGFDEAAEQRSVQRLTEELPRLIHTAPDKRIVFGELFKSTCNSTPASSVIYREALGALLADREIEVIGQDGSQRRSAQRISKDDLIIIPPQLKLLIRK